MTVVINGTSGITDVNGTAAAPAITGTDTDTGVFFGTNTVSLSTGGTERLQVDSSGNLGLGVTPSAWSIGKAVQIGSAGDASILGYDARAYLSANAYYNGGWKYANASSKPAMQYIQQNGQHEWYYASSGTAGNAITFTQAMTLDASGNLGVGTSSFSRRVNFAIADSTAYNSSSFEATPLCTYIRNTDATIGSYAGLQFAVGSNGDAAIAGVRTADASCAITFGTRNVGSGSIVERARIDSSGNLLVGTTSVLNSAKFSLYQTNNSFAAVVQNTSSAVSGAYGIQVNLTQDPNSTDSFFYKGTGNATDRFYVRANGGIGNYQANNVNLSDRREKTDFVPSKSYLKTICAIPVQTFKYIDQTDDEPNLGVVAQDVQAVAPELVTESNWGTEEEPKMRLSIYQTDLQYALMKCIQEMKTIIDQQAERIAALEAK